MISVKWSRRSVQIEGAEVVWAMKGFAPQTPAILAPDETLQTAQARRPN